MSLSIDLGSIAGNTVILQGCSNYQKWAWSIEGTAQLGTFWSAYDGTNKALDDTPEKLEAAANRETKALGLIKKTVDPIVALEIQSLTIADTTATGGSRPPNAKEVWDHLKKLYQKSDGVSALLDYRLLHHTVLNDDGTLEAQLNNLAQLRSRCTLNGLSVKDYEFAAIILISLPDSYSHIAESLLASTKIEDLKVEEVCAKILETEIRRKGETDPSTNAIRKSGQSSSLNKKKPKGACYKCGNKGHWANRCPDKSSNDVPAATPPQQRKDPVQNVARTSDNPAVNIVEESSTSEQCEPTIQFYDQTGFRAEAWFMDSVVIDHMAPWGTDFIEYTLLSPNGYVALEMGDVLHVSGIKKLFLSTDRLVRQGFQVILSTAGAEAQHTKKISARPVFATDHTSDTTSLGPNLISIVSMQLNLDLARTYESPQLGHYQASLTR